MMISSAAIVPSVVQRSCEVHLSLADRLFQRTGTTSVEGGPYPVVSGAESA